MVKIEKIEDWKIVEEIPIYEISSNGNVRNIISGHVLKNKINKYGYPCIGLYYNGKKIYRTIHRLVANAFVSGKASNLQVNHKDGVKTNNHYTNLEWCTAQENINHSYMTMLNGNTSKVTVVDLTSNMEFKFKSIKQTCRWLGLSLNVVVPLIKNSFKTPILGKYALTINDVSLMKNRANTLNFGKSIYVYDTISNEVLYYPSLLIAKYETGFRGLSKNTIDDGKLHIGYMFSYKSCFKEMPIDKKKVLDERMLYLETPHRKFDQTYILYDYYNCIENNFENIQLLVEHVNSSVSKELNVKPRNVSDTLCSSADRGNTGLIRGFGVKSTMQNFEWTAYNEEVILSSKFGYLAPIRFYRVTVNNDTMLIHGVRNLCQYLGYKPNKLIDNVTVEDINKSLNNPTIIIQRLNKPIN